MTRMVHPAMIRVALPVRIGASVEAALYRTIGVAQ